MKRVGKSKADEKWLKSLGQNIAKLIQERGYSSPYEFWVEKAGDQISRAALNYILNGEKDPKATTLKILADLLEVEMADLFSFK